MSRWPWRGGRKRAVGLIERAIGEVCPQHDPSTACCLGPQVREPWRVRGASWPAPLSR